MTRKPLGSSCLCSLNNCGLEVQTGIPTFVLFNMGARDSNSDPQAPVLQKELSPIEPFLQVLMTRLMGTFHMSHSSQPLDIGRVQF